MVPAESRLETVLSKMNNSIRFRDNLAAMFDSEELNSLCFDLGIDYENLPGTTKHAKAEALIQYCARYGKMNALLERCRQLRPNAAWAQLSEADVLSNPQIFTTTAPSLTPEQKANLERQHILLQRVNDFWVRDVLEFSTQGKMLIDLEEKAEHTATEQPWQKNFATETKAGQVDQSIYTIFENAHRSLLILGQPGSGKTTTVITLARDLVAAAEREPSQPIPVILTLVSWQNRRQSLNDWIVDELKTKYQIPAKFGRQWLEDDDLILLLDGLDEVSLRHRPNCVLAINKFREEHGLTGIAVSSRESEYAELGVKLTLDSAISLQPLSSSKIDAYLNSYGPATSSLRLAIQMDATLRQLAQSPLMLNVMCKAYAHRDDLPQTLSASDTWSGQQRLGLRNELFATYVDSIFKQQTTKPAYSQEITENQLGWLASQMKSHNQTIFQLDQIQPSWLPSHLNRTIYLILTRSLFGLITGLYMWLFDFSTLLATLIIPLNVVIGLGLGIFQALTFENRYSKNKEIRSRTRWLWQEAVLLGVIATVVVTSGLLLIFNILGQELSVPEAFFYGLLNGAVCALSAYFSFGTDYEGDIRVAESLSWSWNGVLRGFLTGLIVGLVLGFVGGIALDYPLRQQLLLGLESGLLWSLYGGLKSRRLESRVNVHKAHELALRNSVIAASLFGLVYGSFIAILWGLPLGVLRALQLFFGAGLLYGGIDVLKYLILRTLFYFTGHISATYSRFLEFAVELNLLHKVGGGFIFMHRLLQDYFVLVDLRASR